MIILTKQKTINDLHLDIMDLGFKIDQQNEKFVTKHEFDQKHTLVMVTLEKVLKEVLAMRQEQSTHYQQHEDSNNEIKNIKKELKSWKTGN